MLHRSTRIPSTVLFVLGFFQFIGQSVHAAVSNIAVGQTYSLSVTADGSAPFSYQWYHDGVAMSGVTGSIYSGTAKASDAGSYYATVSNAAGSATSDSVTLAVVSLPAFTTQPASQTVIAGSGVTFSAAANGTPMPTYQWRKNSVNIPGATAASYSISPAATADAGSYTVVATNTAGSVTSSVATLTVNTATVAPAITTQPASQTVVAGANVSFSVTASGTPAPTFQWKLNGTVISGATGATLTLSNVQTTNAGSYTVVAANSAGSVTSVAATLTVNPLTVAPVITSQPGNQTVSAGAAVTLSASASGTPAPTYQWKKNGVAISGATAASYVIASATSASAGTYSIVASNSAGSATSSGAILTVNATASSPVITSQPASQAVKKGGSVTFTVVASGTPAPTYQWRKNGATIKGATSAAYTISNLTSSNAGTYSVVVTNSGGSVTSSGAVLTVTSVAAALPLVDFNADSKTDLVWQNVLTGEFNVWFMNGTTMDDAVSLGSFDSKWKIGAVADFNADGSPDIFCQNTSTGEWSIWLMSDLAISSKVSLGVQPLNSRVCGAGDFNGDHRPDLVVQDSASGKVSIWLMSGTQRTSIVSVGTLAANWQVCGVGDFDVNGKSDLVLQNSVTGQLNLWFMTGTKVTWKTGSTTLAPEWQVCGTGDLNGNGKSDLLCQNVLTGECEILIMGSNNAVSSRLSLGIQPIEWVIRN
jgi:hypothetical protein